MFENQDIKRCGLEHSKTPSFPGSRTKYCFRCHGHGWQMAKSAWEEHKTRDPNIRLRLYCSKILFGDLVHENQVVAISFLTPVYSPKSLLQLSKFNLSVERQRQGH